MTVALVMKFGFCRWVVISTSPFICNIYALQILRDYLKAAHNVITADNKQRRSCVLPDKIKVQTANKTGNKPTYSI